MSSNWVKHAECGRRINAETDKAVKFRTILLQSLLRMRVRGARDDFAHSADMCWPEYTGLRNATTLQFYPTCADQDMRVCAMR